MVWYSGPGQHNNITNHLDSDMEDDSQALLNLERNIANIERSMSASQLTKSDLTSILNRQVGYCCSQIIDISVSNSIMLY